MPTPFSAIPEMPGQDISRECAVDLSAKQYCFVKIVSGLVVAAGAGDLAIGILQNKPVGTTARHATAQIRCFGFSRLVCGTLWTAGAYIAADSAGAGNPVTADHSVYNAIAVGDQSSADIGAVMLQRGTISV